MSLETETKKAINFREVKTCSTCKHRVERECSHVDRMWYDHCEYSNVCSFQIVDKSRSTCDSHEPEAQ